MIQLTCPECQRKVRRPPDELDPGDAGICTSCACLFLIENMTAIRWPVDRPIPEEIATIQAQIKQRWS